MKNLRIYVDFAAPPDALELLRQGCKGHELIFARKPGDSVLAPSESDPQFTMADVAFGQPDPQGFAEAPDLKWIQISSSGITRYDTPQLRELMAQRKIAMCNSASVYREACAVHVLSFMLAQARHLPVALQTRAAHGTDAWRTLRGASSTLRGETVLILGFGSIGRRLADLLYPFGTNIIAGRRKPQGDENVRVVTGDQLSQTLGEADHVVNILPDNAESRQFFNAGRFGAMKRGAVFYNIGRGTTVDQNALLDALRSARLKAAWLDVTEPEPLPDHHPLLAEPNCFITPHLAGGHPGEFKALVNHFLGNLNRFMRGEPFLDRVM